MNLGEMWILVRKSKILTLASVKIDDWTKIIHSTVQNSFVVHVDESVFPS